MIEALLAPRAHRSMTPSQRFEAAAVNLSELKMGACSQDLCTSDKTAHLLPIVEHDPLH